MNNPKSIFTAPEDFGPSSQQQGGPKSPSYTFKPAPPPASSPRAEQPSQTANNNIGIESTTKTGKAWPQTPTSESLSAVGSAGPGNSAVDPLGFVPTLGQLAGKKRAHQSSTSDQQQYRKPAHKKLRLHNFYQLEALDYSQPQPPRSIQQPPPAHPPSPLFFSHSTHVRPALPPRFSSGEAGERMLRQADAEESKVRTVKLARAAYSGSSPPAIGLPSYRSTPSSTLQDAGSPEVWLHHHEHDTDPAAARGGSGKMANVKQAEEGRGKSSQQLLSHVGIGELL